VAGKKQVIPEFVDRFALDQGRHKLIQPIAGVLKDSGALLTPDEFVRCCTAGGKLYHGTPRPESALAILRGGMFISKDGQGGATFGRGGYMSKDFDTAKGYAQEGGVVFELGVKHDPHLTVLDWEKAKDLPEMVRIKKAAEAAGRDVFEVLARDYGVDIIVNHHVLVQNADALIFPHKASQLVLPFYHQITGKAASLQSRLRSLRSFVSLSEYMEALGDPVSPELIHGIERSLIDAAVGEVNNASQSLSASVRVTDDFEPLAEFFLSRGKTLPRAYLDGVMQALLTRAALEDPSTYHEATTAGGTGRYELLKRLFAVQGEEVPTAFGERMQKAVATSKVRQDWFDSYEAWARRPGGANAWMMPPRPRRLDDLMQFYRTSGMSDQATAATLKEVVSRFESSAYEHGSYDVAADALAHLVKIRSGDPEIADYLAEFAFRSKPGKLGDLAFEDLGRLQNSAADRAAELLLDEMVSPRRPAQGTFWKQPIALLARLAQSTHPPVRDRVIGEMLKVLDTTSIRELFSEICKRLPTDVLRLPGVQASLFRNMERLSHGENLSYDVADALARVPAKEWIPEVYEGWHEFSESSQEHLADAAIDQGIVHERIFETYASRLNAYKKPHASPVSRDFASLGKLLHDERAQRLLVEHISTGSIRLEVLSTLLETHAPLSPEIQKWIAERISPSLDGVCAAAIALKHGFAVERATAAINHFRDHAGRLDPADFFEIGIYEVLAAAGDRRIASRAFDLLLEPPHGLKTPMAEFGRRMAAIVKKEGLGYGPYYDRIIREWSKAESGLKPALAGILREGTAYSRDASDFIEKLKKDPDPAIRAAALGRATGPDRPTCIKKGLRRL
jgi:hypothetical protein